MLYFGFALAVSMLPEGQFSNTVISSAQATDEISRAGEGLGICLNPSHKETIFAMEQRFGIHVPIPAAPAKVKLQRGDSLLVMGVVGLPRLSDPKRGEALVSSPGEYTREEIDSASFSFNLITAL